MGKKIDPKKVESALGKVSDEASFIQELLVGLLEWPIDSNVETVEQIAYDWSKDELRAANLDKKVVEGRIRQLALPDCPWGIFIVEFKNPDVFESGRGMTVPLRQVLSGLVPKQKRAAHLPSFFHRHLLFICTHGYRYFRFVHFKDPGADFKQPPLASFGWWPGDSVKTVSTFNLPHLVFLDPSASVDEWIDEWTNAFDVERVTKKFYTDYKDIHALFQEQLKGVPAADRAWLASVLLNRLMFVYFLQRKGFLAGGNETYLEDKLKATKGKDRFYTDFLTLLFFEGFAKPWGKRSDLAKKELGPENHIRYLNGGLFLEHPIEQRTHAAGKIVSVPDSVFERLFTLFGSFSWNLNDKPGGQDNEINPDVLGYIVEKYINQKSFGAYYTRPEITGYLCERTIHNLILDAVNTPEQSIEAAKKAGLPIRAYKNVAEMLRKLDPALTTKLLDDVLPTMALLDPACGSGAFLVAAMKTLIDIYATIYGWIQFNGSPSLKARLREEMAKHKSIDYFIKKRIITDNLFGVDIMEEAVEIARLRLFLALAASANTVDELEPLPNIDFNILRGNSLIGLMHVDAKRVEATSKTGHLGGLLFHQKSYADVLADRNRQLQNYRDFSAYADDLTALRDQITAMNAEAQKTLDELLLADFEDLGIKYEQATWDDDKGEQGKPKKRPLKLADIQALHPFHWAFSFDKVMGRGGFDAIITNPPWEIVKPNGKEFFEQHSELVTKKNMSIHDFQDEQKKLLNDHEIRSSWLEYLSGFPYQSGFFRSAPDYSNQIGTVNGKKVGSDLNLYKLFTERCYRLLRKDGRCGIVIPSGIYTDLGARQLRLMLFDHGRVHHLRSFSNERWIFETVHHAFKFCLMIFARGDKTEKFEASFRINPREAISPSGLERFLEDPDCALMIEWPLVKKLSPDSLSIMEFKQALDVKIAQKMLHFPLLGQEVNGWPNLRFTREFDMTQGVASALVHDEPAPGLEALYEGKMIWHFDSRFGKAQYWVSRKLMRAYLLGRGGDSRKMLNADRFRLVFRRQASNTNERTLVTTIIPPAFHADNLAGIDATIENSPDLCTQLFLTAAMNSFVVDGLIRQMVTTNLNFFYLYQMPIPRIQPSTPEWTQCVVGAARLICVSKEFDTLAEIAGLDPPDHRAGVTNPTERSQLRAILDGLIAHLYGLTEEEFVHVLSAFPLVPESAKIAARNAYRDFARGVIR